MACFWNPSRLQAEARGLWDLGSARVKMNDVIWKKWWDNLGKKKKKENWWQSCLLWNASVIAFLWAQAHPSLAWCLSQTQLSNHSGPSSHLFLWIPLPSYQNIITKQWPCGPDRLLWITAEHIHSHATYASPTTLPIDLIALGALSNAIWVFSQMY